jgi:hypothetical protein
VKEIKKNLSNSMKNQIMVIEKGEEMQAKGIHNIFNKIIAENFPMSQKRDAHLGTGSLQDTKET